MKRRITSVLAILIAITIFIAPTANAATNASMYLNSYLAYIYPEGNGDMSIWFEVQGTETMDEIGALRVRLQEKPSGSSTWTTVKTFSYTNYSNLLGHNNNFYCSHVDYSGKVGYSYRAYVTVWAGQDGNGDSRVILTNAVIA